MLTDVTFCPAVQPHSPGRNPEVLLDEITSDSQRQKGDDEDGGHVGNDPQCRHTQQGRAGETLQGGGDVLVNGVCVCGKSVEDAAEGSRLKQPGGTTTMVDQNMNVIMCTL